MKFHSPVKGLSIKWCTYVSDWDARGEKLEVLKKLEILKKLETSRADEERQRRVLGGSPLDTD